MMNTKSKFDSGFRGEENGLPHINDIEDYIQHLFTSEPNKCYSRKDVLDLVIQEFEVPISVQTNCGNSETPLFNSRINFILSDLVNGHHENHNCGSPITGDPIIKRVGVGIYQHLTGDKPSLGVNSRKQFTVKKFGKRVLSDIMVSIKLLLNVSHYKNDKDGLILELVDSPISKSNGWTVEMIEQGYDLVTV